MNNEYFMMFSRILEHSIKKHKNADQPITVGHLSNMTKLAIKLVDKKEADFQKYMDKVTSEIFEDQHKYGTNG